MSLAAGCLDVARALLRTKVCAFAEDVDAVGAGAMMAAVVDGDREAVELLLG